MRCDLINKTKTAGIVFLIFAIVWSFVIWSFSLKDADSSTVDSDAATSVVEDVLEAVLGTDIEVDTNLIRKLAHFFEFAVLGFFVFMGFYFSEFKKRAKITLPLAWCLLVGSIDEFLQLFSEGRGAKVTDVLLDFSGSLAAVLILTALVSVINKKSRV